eukprot:GHVL01006085.1.p1 GENE.GHVL01006085.1~~GHVL01006085.1.p1  ORF type:complete len:293 (-),score=79.56 GHVL01006085.1:203-1081(-)
MKHQIQISEELHSQIKSLNQQLNQKDESERDELIQKMMVLAKTNEELQTTLRKQDEEMQELRQCFDELEMENHKLKEIEQGYLSEIQTHNSLSEAGHLNPKQKIKYFEKLKAELTEYQNENRRLHEIVANTTHQLKSSKGPTGGRPKELSIRHNKDKIDKGGEHALSVSMLNSDVPSLIEDESSSSPIMMAPATPFFIPDNKPLRVSVTPTPVKNKKFLTPGGCGIDKKSNITPSRLKHPSPAWRNNRPPLGGVKTSYLRKPSVKPPHRQQRVEEAPPPSTKNEEISPTRDL